jgi:hypothetical protein
VEVSEGRRMIPTMIVFGLLLGRWWWAALIAAAVLWPALLVADGVIALSTAVVGAALFAVVNAAVGVAIHQAGLWGVRRLRSANRPAHAS